VRQNLLRRGDAGEYAGKELIMSTEERREEIDVGLPGVTVTAVPQTDTPTKKAEFAPHQVIDLQGTLSCGQPLPRSAQELSTLCLPALTEMVEQAGVWNIDSTDSEARLGDYRFLVLNFTDAADICRYAQIWSEPNCELTMEVGPGNREDAVLQAIADRMRPALIGRGFEIGGGANNFGKHLIAPSASDCARVAHEMLAILTEILGYDGTADLAYQLHQNTHLTAAHVISGINRSQLFDWFKFWNLNPSHVYGEDKLLEARERDLAFRVVMRVPKVKRNGFFWEIHCYTTFSLPNDAAAELIAEYNAKSGLFKVFAGSHEDEPMREIGIATGINLAGGVTPAHIRSQIMEWLDAARRLRLHRARQSEQSPPAAMTRTLN
jgi:hypothetical protein